MMFFVVSNMQALEDSFQLDINNFNEEWHDFVSSKNIDPSKIGKKEYRHTEFSVIEEWGEEQFPRRRESISGMDDRDFRWLPFKENKITLSEGIEMSASYINLNGSKKGQFHNFIATHAPLKNNVDLFWKMIWENEIEQVVMVTEMTDNGVKHLCHPYLPEAMGEKLQFDFGLEMQCINEKWILSEHKENIQMRTFQVNYQDKKRIITHYWYHNWPDQTAPENTKTMTALIQIVAQDKETLQSSTPILVHCAAGVGRTGTFIASYHLSECAAKGIALPKVFDLVGLLRWQRPKMVSKPEQYHFCYRYIHELQEVSLSTLGPSKD